MKIIPFSLLAIKAAKWSCLWLQALKRPPEDNFLVFVNNIANTGSFMLDCGCTT